MGHTSDRDINDSIFKQKPKTTPDDSTIAYTLLLKEVEPTDDVAYAKEVIYNGFKTFYVKSSQSRLFNPFGMYDENTENKSRNGLRKWKFIAVPKKAYDHYLKFLKTKNPVWLSNAERENS